MSAVDHPKDGYDWISISKTAILVLSPGASVLVLLAMDAVKEMLVWALAGGDFVARSSSERSSSSSISCSRRSATPRIKHGCRSGFRVTPNASSGSARRSKTATVVSSVMDVMVQLVSLVVLSHMLQLMGLEILEMFVADDHHANETSLLSRFLTAISSEMSTSVLTALIGAGSGLAVVAVLLGHDDGDDPDTSASGRSAPRGGLVREYGLFIAMTLHTLSEGVAAALVDQRAGSVAADEEKSDVIDEVSNGGEISSMWTPYFVALAAHNVCEGLVVAISAKSKRSAPSSSWVLPAAAQSIFSHISQPLAYGATSLLLSSDRGISLVVDTIPAVQSTVAQMSLTVDFPLLVSSFAFGSLLGTVAFEVLPSVTSAVLSVSRRTGGNKPAHNEVQSNL